MLSGGSHPHLHAQQMTTQAPPSATPLPDDPAQELYPVAVPFASDAGTDTVTIESDDPQTYQDGVYTLDRNVVIVWGTRRAEADHIVYDSNTGEVTATGMCSSPTAATTMSACRPRTERSTSKRRPGASST